MRLSAWKLAGLVAGLAAFALLALADTALQHHPVHGAAPARAAAVTALMALWWLTEAVPIHVTACLPLVLFPLGRVFGPDPLAGAVASAAPYADPYIFLFTGGMCIAAAMQQWGLHRRIALSVMRLIGTDARRLLLGFLVATAFVSLWISNTATAAMMLPIGMALIAQLERRAGGARLTHYGAAVMLAVAYASNIGGIGTKIGTAPNAAFCGFVARLGVDIDFLDYLVVGLPFVALMLPLTWLVLWRTGRADAPRGSLGETALRQEIDALGPMRRGEWVVLAVFIATAALWIAAKPLTDLARPHVTWTKLGTAHVEGAVAMSAALVLLLWPVAGRRALALTSLRTVPWSTLLLLGGSFSMAQGVQSSGLSDHVSAQLHVVRDLAPFAQVLLASLVTVALSAVASNTATITVMLNVLADAVSPAHRMSVLWASTIAASCDFALPAGTPPNAIVFGSGYLTVARMARTGVVLDVAAAVLAAAWCHVVVAGVV
jgi:sodium-dependent dicarboxylate transporter 2/3/5